MVLAAIDTIAMFWARSREDRANASSRMTNRGAGNSSLAFDDVLGERDDLGGGYLGRFGPRVIGAVADEDSGFDLGAMFQRPIGNKDYRWTARIAEGVYAAAELPSDGDSLGTSAADQR